MYVLKTHSRMMYVLKTHSHMDMAHAYVPTSGGVVHVKVHLHFDCVKSRRSCVHQPVHT